MSLKLITVDDTVMTNVLGFKDNNFSVIFNNIRGITFWARKIDKKCMHLSNFPTVTLPVCPYT
jgi:hypothetical protein